MGLIKTAAKVAVATHVYGRIRQRQDARWAAENPGVPAPHASLPTYLPATPPTDPAAGPPSASSDLISQLRGLGELRDGGVLTDAEFQEQKRRLLAAQG